MGVSKKKGLSLASKFMEHTLNGSNYYDWSHTIRLYLWSTKMDDHITKDPLKDDRKKTCLRDEA